MRYFHMPVHMVHVLSMYCMCAHRVWRTKCVLVCMKCWTGTEAIEVETLTQNNVAMPRLPASGETSTELCSLWKHHRNKPTKLRFHFQLITLLCHEFRKICKRSKSRTKRHPHHLVPILKHSLFVFACTFVSLITILNTKFPLSLFPIISCLLCLSLLTNTWVLSQVASGVCSSLTEPGGWEDTYGECPYKWWLMRGSGNCFAHKAHQYSAHVLS